MNAKFYKELKEPNFNSKQRQQIVKDLKEILNVFGYILNYLIENNVEVPQHRYMTSIHSYCIR